MGTPDCHPHRSFAPRVCKTATIDPNATHVRDASLRNICRVAGIAARCAIGDRSRWGETAVRAPAVTARHGAAAPPTSAMERCRAPRQAFVRPLRRGARGAASSAGATPRHSPTAARSRDADGRRACHAAPVGTWNQELSVRRRPGCGRSGRRPQHAAGSSRRCIRAPGTGWCPRDLPEWLPGPRAAACA